MNGLTPHLGTQGKLYMAKQSFQFVLNDFKERVV